MARPIKVISAAEALQDLHETMQRHRAEIVRLAGDDWRKAVDDIRSGGSDLKIMDVWCAAALRRVRRLSVPIEIDLYDGKASIGPVRGKIAADLLAALDGDGQIVGGGVSGLCKRCGVGSPRLTRAWALGDLGVEGYTALARALNSRVAKLSAVRTTEQATAEARARVEARQQHFGEIAAKPPQVASASTQKSGQWLTREDACDALNCSPRTLARKVEAGEVERQQDGRNGLYRAGAAAAKVKTMYHAHVKLRSGGTMDLTASEISVDDSGVLLEGEGMSLALNSQAVAEVTIKWEVR